MNPADPGGRPVEDLCSSIENLHDPHGQTVISDPDRHTPADHQFGPLAEFSPLPVPDYPGHFPETLIDFSEPGSPAELMMYSRERSPSPPGRRGYRSPSRLQAQPLGLSAPSTSTSHKPHHYEPRSVSQSLPNSPFFNQNEIEQHGLKAREITQKLIKSLNETKGRLDRHNHPSTYNDPNPFVDNILEKTVTVSPKAESYKRRLFNSEDEPNSIIRRGTSPKKMGPVVFDTRSQQSRSPERPHSEYTDNSFNTLPQDSFRSGFVNSENECLGIFDETVRRPDFGEFIPGLRELEHVTTEGGGVSNRVGGATYGVGGATYGVGGDSMMSGMERVDLSLSPGAKKAMETVNGVRTNLRPEDYSHISTEEIREVESVRSNLHNMLQSTPRYKDRLSSQSQSSYYTLPANQDTRDYTPTTNQGSNRSSSNQRRDNTWCQEPAGGDWSSRGNEWTNQRAGGEKKWTNPSPRRGRSPVRRWRGTTDWTAVAQREAERPSYNDLDFDEIMQLASRTRSRDRTGTSRDVLPRDTSREGTWSRDLESLERSTEPGEMEVRVLRDNCEREKFRRQHCERIIETLQRRLADSQEQLTMSVSTEKKKDVIIDQLDKTLSRVVDGWKQREAEKQAAIEKLKAEADTTARKLDEKTEMMSKFESSLQEALADLATEQKKVADLEKFKEEEHEKEHERLTGVMGNQQQKLVEVEGERDSLRDQLDDMTKKHAQLEEVLLEERSGWQETTEDLKLKINNLDTDFRGCLTSEKSRADQAEVALEGTKEVLSSVQKELLKTQADVDTVTRERNTLRVELGLLEARMESSKRKLEADLTHEFDKTLSKKLSEAEDKHLQVENELRESQQKMMHDLSEKNQKTLDEAIQTLKENFSTREQAYKDEIKTLEERLEQMSKELQEVRLAKQRIEAQRDRLNPEEQWHDIKKEDLVKNLRGLMDSHAQAPPDTPDDCDSGTAYDEPDAPHHPAHFTPRDQSQHEPGMTSLTPTSQSAYRLPSGLELLANERERNPYLDYSFVHSAPASYPPSTGRYHGDSDFDDGVSDVLSNDGGDLYYPISEPPTRYATPTLHLSSNRYRAPSHVITPETPRYHAPDVTSFRTPMIIAPPIASSTELRKGPNHGGSLLSSGYYSNATPSGGNRYSVGSTAEFRPLQSCHDDTINNFDTDGGRHGSRALSPRSRDGSRGLSPRSRDGLNDSRRSLREHRDAEPRYDESFRSLPNGRSTLHESGDRSDRSDRSGRQSELHQLVGKLLSRSGTDMDNSKENMPPHSPPQKLERSQPAEPVKSEKSAPSGVLTPAQVGEIQRLLHAYQHGNGTDTNKIEELLGYLKDAQHEQDHDSPDGGAPPGDEEKNQRLVSVSHAPKYASSTSAARQKLYERSNKIATGANANNNNSSLRSGSSSSHNKSRPLGSKPDQPRPPGSKPDRKVATKSSSRASNAWR